jgi:hypothetical protein
MQNGGIGSWGDEGSGLDTKRWFSIAYDLNNHSWIARNNFLLCRQFFGSVSESARQSGPDLQLSTSSGVVVLANYQYITELAAKREGNAFKGTVPGRMGGTFYVHRTRYVRQLDASALTPAERLAEMTDLAIRDPRFAGQLQHEFGMLADPMVLLSIAAIMGLFIGIGAGAMLLGGAAFAAAVTRLLGAGMLVHQASEYVTLFDELQQCVYANDQHSFYMGIKVVQKILGRVLMDISMVVGMGGAMKIGSKAAGVFKSLVLRYAPAQWLEAGQSGMATMRSAAKKMANSRWGYMREDLMERVTDFSKLFERGEDAVFRRRSAASGEMIVIRGPSADRLQWLQKLRGWIEGKPEWIKAKSWMGWHGIVGIPKSPEIDAIVRQGARSRYRMGNLQGVFDEVDAFIAQHPTCEAFEVPYGKNFTDPIKGKKVFDWDAAGANYSLAKGAKLVDIGDRYILVDSLGRPICQDLDLGMIQKLGTKHSGAHLPKGRANPEDNFLAEEVMNYQFYTETGNMYNPIKHSGAGGSDAHIYYSKQAGKNHWTPREGAGFAEEPLYVYLPKDRGKGTVSELFKFKGWAEFELFLKENHFPYAF